MYYTDNPVRDAENYYHDLDSRLPVCWLCDEEITDDYYEINGDCICKKCLDKKYLVSV